MTWRAMSGGPYTRASGATAILPLLASWVVSVPAAVGLLAKGQGVRAAALVLLHWAVLVGPATCCSPRHRMPFDSRNKG